MATDAVRTRFAGRASLGSYLGLLGLALAAGACASPAAERTAGHSAAGAPLSATPSRSPPGNPSAGRAVALVNPGFESAASGPDGDPQGWYTGQHAGDQSYLFTIDAAAKVGGTRSLRIDNVGIEPFGSVVQVVPARPLATKTVRFSAWLKTQAANAGGASLFIIAEVGGGIVAYDFMAGSEVKGTTDWARHSVTVLIPAQADLLRVGATLRGTGSVWFDDAELEIAP